MAQHDFVIDNGPGLAVRTDMNAAFAALVSQNAGPVEPATRFPGMLWLDTTVAPNGLLRQRNQANNAWVTPTVQPATFGDIQQLIIQTSQTWNKPAGLRFLDVVAIGAGGGSVAMGDQSPGFGAVAAGGGGGGYARSLFAAASLPATVSLTVGSATASAAGGNTSFGAGMIASGGGLGQSTFGSATAWTQANPGAGGTVSGAQLSILGGNGEPGVKYVDAVPGLLWGGGGGGTAITPARTGIYISSAAGGGVSSTPGGGARGGGTVSASGTVNGVPGGNGLIILTEYY